MSKGDRTRQAMLEATLDLLDESGTGGVSLQVLGERLGMHPTSIYRYFSSVDDLLAASLEFLLSKFDTTSLAPEDPRDRLVSMCTAIRELFHGRPGAAALLAITSGDRVTVTSLAGPIFQALRELGVPESRFAVSYQSLESFVLGSTLFDFSGSPQHLESRRRRHAAVGDPTMNAATVSAARVDAVNEESFRFGLEALLDRIESQAP